MDAHPAAFARLGVAGSQTGGEAQGLGELVYAVAMGDTDLESRGWAALLVGLTSGAYSSLFVAAPIVSWLKEREPKWAYTGEAGLPADARSHPILPRAARREATGRAIAPTAAPAGAVVASPPKPPRITLKNERFIALHMM